MAEKVSTDEIRKMCPVCGDIACGQHYGVHPCLECKRFFCKSIVQKKQYKPCQSDQPCSISSDNRIRCKSCHLKKCLDVGMFCDDIHYDRFPQSDNAQPSTSKSVTHEGESSGDLDIDKNLDPSKQSRKTSLKKVGNPKNENPKIPAEIKKVNERKKSKRFSATRKIEASKRETRRKLKKRKVKTATKKTKKRDKCTYKREKCSYRRQKCYHRRETIIIKTVHNINDLKHQNPNIYDEKKHENAPQLEKPKITSEKEIKTNFPDKKLNIELNNELELIDSIKKAYKDTLEATKGMVDICKNTQTHSNSLELICPFNTSYLINQSVAHCKRDLFERYAPTILGVIQFAKSIPYFETLHQRDQNVLLKAGVFEVILVRWSYLFTSLNSSNCFKMVFLGKDSIEADFFLISMVNFAEKMNNLHLSKKEVALLCALVLIAADHPELRNTVEVSKVQNKLIGVLQKLLTANHPENTTIFKDLMKMIPDLRILNCLHSNKHVDLNQLECGENKPSITVREIIQIITDAYISNTVKYGNEFFSIHHNLKSQINLLVTLSDLRCNSPGQQSTGSSSSSTIIYDLNSIDLIDCEKLADSFMSLSLRDSNSPPETSSLAECQKREDSRMSESIYCNPNTPSQSRGPWGG